MLCKGCREVITQGDAVIGVYSWSGMDAFTQYFHPECKGYRKGDQENEDEEFARIEREGQMRLNLAGRTC